MMEHSKMFPKADKHSKADKNTDKSIEVLSWLKNLIYPGFH